jgi:hypothetical protein
MAWNDNPKVRELGAYADKHGFEQAVVVGINTASNAFEVISYGNNAQKCDKARKLGDRIYLEIANGEIEVE